MPKDSYHHRPTFLISPAFSGVGGVFRRSGRSVERPRDTGSPDFRSLPDAEGRFLKWSIRGSPDSAEASRQCSLLQKKHQVILGKAKAARKPCVMLLPIGMKSVRFNAWIYVPSVRCCLFVCPSCR